MSDDWRQSLREARTRERLSRAALARTASVSPETVRNYEDGRRPATAPTLKKLLDALKLERGARNQLLLDAGFAPDGFTLRPSYNLDYTIEQAADLIETYAWPSFVMNEMHEVLAANATAQELWGVDLRHEFADPIERNLLSVASNPRFAERCVNWDEAVGVIAAGFKSHTRGPEDIDAPSPYMQAVLERFFAGDEKYVKRFLDAWEKAPYREIRMRWSYPVVWDEPDAGRMRFHGLVSSMSESDGYACNDWIRLDAATWDALERVKERRSRR
jgi:transcriptional regulator with XRE-family HTH domain